MFENPRRGRQPRNFTTNVQKILDLKSSFEQIFSKNWRWVPMRNVSWYRKDFYYHNIIRWILIYKTKKVSLRYAQVNIKCQTLYIAIIRRFQLQERQYATFHVKSRYVLFVTPSLPPAFFPELPGEQGRTNWRVASFDTFSVCFLISFFLLNFFSVCVICYSLPAARIFP